MQMHKRIIDPLEPALWLDALRKLCRRVSTDDSGIEELLRHAFHLLQLSPAPLRGVLPHELDEASFEHLLECRAFESAALALMGAYMTLELTRRPAQAFIAKAWLSEDACSISVTSPCAASALLGAWCSALFGLSAPKSATPRRDSPEALFSLLPLHSEH